MRTSTSDGSRSFSVATAAFTLRPVSTMLASCAFWMSSVIAGRPLTRAKLVISFSPSMTSATCDRYTGPPPCCATMIRLNCSGSLILPSTRTTESLWPRVRRPAGTSWFAFWIAWITWSTPIPSAVSAFGLIWISTWRVTRPLTSTRATPGWFSSALTIVWSVSDVSSRSPVVCDMHGERGDRLVVLVLDAIDERILDVARETRTHDRDLVADVLDRHCRVGRQPELDEHLARSLARVARRCA